MPPVRDFSGPVPAPGSLFLCQPVEARVYSTGAPTPYHEDAGERRGEGPSLILGFLRHWPARADEPYESEEPDQVPRVLPAVGVPEEKEVHHLC